VCTGYSEGISSSESNNDSNDNRVYENKVSKHIKNLEFHRGLNGAATFDIIFDTSISAYKDYTVETSKDGYSLTLTFDEADISDSWVSEIDTKVFNTIIDSIEITHENNKVIFKLYSLAKISYTERKEKNSLKVMVDRKKSKIDGFNVYEPISVSFKDTPINTVLQVLSDLAGLNLVISSNVQGNISIDLKDVPWNEVLNVVLISKGLATKKMNSILYVAPAQEVANQVQLEQQTKLSEQNTSILVTEFIPLNYTTATAAQQVISAMSGSVNGGILSSRGKLTSDIRTNTLIVTDTEDSLKKVKEIIREIDIPNDQVLIEARIVLVDRNSSLELGFNYGVTGAGGLSSLGLNTFTPVEGAFGATAKLAYTVAGGVQLSMEIVALETEGKSNQVSSPHLIVTNNQTAFIKQGKEIPYREASASGAASVAFKEAVLELEVTPQIAPDGNIVMDIKVTKNNVSKEKVEGEPALEKREIVTKIMAKDSQTVVIGGIYEKDEFEVQDKIPLLGDIPYLGYLFSHTSIINSDRELLIFITPKVIEREID
jgi:type IV pilus assembly protein PilQ